jgi:hypothetical protein
VPEASLESIVFEFGATVLPSCGGELDAGYRSVVGKLTRGNQQIPEVK